MLSWGEIEVWGKTRRDENFGLGGLKKKKIRVIATGLRGVKASHSRG